MEDFTQEKQFEKCQVCLNRKSNYTGYDDICNLRGKQMNFTTYCSDFVLDQSAKNKNDNDEATVENIKDVPIKSTESRAKMSILFIGFVALTDLTLIAGYAWRYILITKKLEGEEVDIDLLSFSDLLIQSFAILHIVLFIVSGIFFIRWLLGIYDNLKAKSIRTRHSRAMVIWSWIIPIINLFYPYQIVSDFDSKLTRLIKQKKPDHAVQTSSIIGLWWTLWILGYFFDRVVLRLPTNTLEEFKSDAQVEVVLYSFDILSALIVIKMIQKFIKKERILFKLEHPNDVLGTL